MSEMNKDVVLSVEDLTINFRTINGMVKAVRGISFDLKRGETVAIVGESGSGKSVSIKAIMGILTGNAVVESGKIMYEGQNLLEISEKDYHKIRGSKIGLIFQDPLSALNPIMKIGKQITETLKLNDPHMSKKEARKRAVELMESVGIPDANNRFDQYPFQFSGGMRQRIVIAIALARDPDVLICDEPTTALDVAVMYYGKIVEMAPADELYRHPLHPYTRALLSAVPQPDPIFEKQRQRMHYDPKVDHIDSNEVRTMREILPEHFVYCNTPELERYRLML